jgi:hypothetical protein
MLLGRSARSAPRVPSMPEELPMRSVYLAFALIVATTFVASNAAEAAPQKRSMRVKFANGDAMTFRLVTMRGRTMMVAPYNQFLDMYHRHSAHGG